MTGSSIKIKPQNFGGVHSLSLDIRYKFCKAITTEAIQLLAETNKYCSQKE